MWPPVPLMTLCTLVMLMSHVRVAMAATTARQQAHEPPPRRAAWLQFPAPPAGAPADAGQRPRPHGRSPSALQDAWEAPLSAGKDLLRWRPPAGPARFALFPTPPAGAPGGGADDAVLVPDEPGGETPAPHALPHDWSGLGRDTAFLLGYQVVAVGVIYLLPESVSQWTAEEKRTSVQRWWPNVHHPTWDRDSWYVNYIGHPYFGATYYIRARERGLGAFAAFGYAALLSCLYEFGVEAFFEQPSYQDLLVTPVGGALLGALLFEPLRERIKGKPERQWYDHLTLTLTDPLGAANGLLERVLGIQTELRIQVRPPGRARHRQEADFQRRPGVYIELMFDGRKRTASRTFPRLGHAG